MKATLAVLAAIVTAVTADDQVVVQTWTGPNCTGTVAFVHVPYGACVGTDGFQSFTILWPAIYVPEAYITVLSPNNCPGIATFEDIANYVTNAGCCGGPRGVRDCFSARNANGGSDAIGTGYAPDHCPKNESLPMVDFTVDS